MKPSALLSSSDTSRATNLAALADSLDYLADMIQGSIMQVRASFSLFGKEAAGALAAFPCNRVAPARLCRGGGAWWNV